MDTPTRVVAILTAAAMLAGAWLMYSTGGWEYPAYRFTISGLTAFAAVFVTACFISGAVPP